jgi:hypothetical protein
MGIIRPVEMKLGRVGAVLVVPTPTAACGYPGWMMIDTAVVGTKGWDCTHRFPPEGRAMIFMSFRDKLLLDRPGFFFTNIAAG